MSKTIPNENIDLGTVFNLKHGYVGGTIVEINVYLLAKMIRSHYARTPKNLKLFIKLLED